MARGRAVCLWLTFTRVRQLLGRGLAAVLLVVACTQGIKPILQPAELAVEQTLSFPVVGDVVSLDPAQVRPGLRLPDPHSVALNVFSGLFQRDEADHPRPAIAAGMPEVSADGRNYTFRLRPEARFSNGDPVRAQDFVYSWNRAAKVAPPSAPHAFRAIEGYQAVVSKQAAAMTGLSAPDDRTLAVRLTEPTGYWITLLADVYTAVVDQKVVQSLGEDAWWKTPAGLIGTGPFRMIARDPGNSFDFVPVANWWGGSTGSLRRVHVQIVKQLADAVERYDKGDFGLVGVGSAVEVGAARTIWGANGRRPHWKMVADGQTTWVSFNVNSGPFAGPEGRDGRLALSRGINRQALANGACGGGDICPPASGGLIARGLDGYLGDGADPNAQFDASAARALYARWDTDGSKVKGLKYAYNESGSLNALVAENLRAQWKANLGIDVGAEPVGGATSFFQLRNRGAYPLSRSSWSADYNSPQNWYDLIWPPGGALYRRRDAFDALIRRANQLSGSDAAPLYHQAGRLLIDDVAYGALFYGRRLYVVKPWLQGPGGGPIYDAPWTGIRILKH